MCISFSSSILLPTLNFMEMFTQVHEDTRLRCHCVCGGDLGKINYPQTEELRESKRVLLQNTVPTICLETRAKSQGTHPKTLGSHGLLGRARFYEVGGTAVFGMFMVYSIFFCIIYKISYELSSKSSLTAMRKKAVHSWTMSTPRQVINP